MAELKTRPTSEDPRAFIDSISDETRRRDAHALCDLFEKVTGEKPVMWGTSIIGFGQCKLKYATGRELDWLVLGFSPRKSSLSLYLNPAIEGYADLLKRLGKHKTGKSCLYVNKLVDIDMAMLETLIGQGWSRRGNSVIADDEHA